MKKIERKIEKRKKNKNIQVILELRLELLWLSNVAIKWDTACLGRAIQVVLIVVITTDRKVIKWEAEGVPDKECGDATRR